MRSCFAAVKGFFFGLLKNNQDRFLAPDAPKNNGEWLAVYTRPGAEKKVADLFEKKGIRSYCPMNTFCHSIGDNRKTSMLPLFSCYVFVYMENGDFSITKGVNGVINFVYWLGKPVVVKDEEIEAIRNLLLEFPYVNLEKIAVNQDVHSSIINDPVMLRKGNLLAVRNNTVKIILPSLGQMLVAVTKKENLENSIHTDDLKLVL